MGKKFSLIIIIIIGAIVIACVFWRLKKIPDDNRGRGLSYFEIVKKDKDCSENCFLEYLVMSNGEIMEKFIKDPSDKNINGINMLVSSTEDVRTLNERVERFFQRLGSNDGIECENCSSYHLYYANGNEKRFFASIESGADPELIEIMKLTENIARNSNKSDVDFFHFYYEKRDSSYLDYHIFTNGTVIRELFGKKNGYLAEARIYLIEHEHVEKIVKILNNDFFNENSEFLECQGKGYLWGYLEIKTSNGFNYTYTCGDGYRNSDAIFNYLYANFN